ncbi:hypothetical protein TNIN_32001 [Trichonephila inaurata madagascariensis]|uniref:Uncharacterized protein n=1 Tax=Trichonephila inaurata madagascariensis TaxID=2747483 RepID=A0A8X6WPV9_9ARAC|nr:hypothetical protein TNIN_32001 [Trichonephila inaurata madagascariensis]
MSHKKSLSAKETTKIWKEQSSNEAEDGELSHMRESHNENITPLKSVSKNEDIESNDSQNQNEFDAHDEKEFLEVQPVD